MNAITSTGRESAFRTLLRTIALALCRLNQIQFDAPWNPRRRRC
jgi:hypothetical protein